jgi:hypothetical protein
MTKYIIGVLAILILGAVGYVLYGRIQAQPVAPPTLPPPALPVTHTYASSTFSLIYADGFTVDENYRYEGVPNKPVSGVKFIIPGAMATGTNLAAHSGVSVESLPRAKTCTADIYFYEDVRAEYVTVGSRVWSIASTSGVGAGNLYEETVYALKDSKPCIALRYFIHSGNIGNYPPGTVAEFNRGALLAEFDKIRDSFATVGAQDASWGATSAPPAIQ